MSELIDPIPLAKDMLFDRLQADHAQLVAQVEAAKAALGEHLDTEIDLAARISELRDEGRAHFHDNTKLSQLVALVKALPVVYGAIEVRFSHEADYWFIWSEEGTCGRFNSKQGAEAYAALLAYRKGMT